MSERRPLDLAALQAPRAAGQRLLRLAGAPQALGRLAALDTWPPSAGFEPLAAMNARQPAGPSEPGGAELPGDAPTRRRGTQRPAPRLPLATPGQRAASTLPAAPVSAAPAPALAVATTPTRAPARLPDPREVAAVMEALLQRPRQGSTLPPMPAMNVHAVPPARLPTAQAAAALMGVLLADTARRHAPATGPNTTTPGAGLPTLAAAQKGTPEQRVLAALQAAAALPPVLSPISTLYRHRPHQQVAAPSPGVVNVQAPSDLAPRAASRLLAASAAAAPSGQQLEPRAPDADDDELLDAITRGLVDQAWLRGVNLG